MRIIMLVMAVVSLVGLSGCYSKQSGLKAYNGPEVTRVIILKGDRRMHLMHGKKALKSYDIDLGFAPEGHKQFEGDGRTPEGRYFVDRRNPNSAFHLSLGISYPNAQDRARAAAAGTSPGGDIFIHGGPRRMDPQGGDWTAGCVSVSDNEIENVFAMVRTGTPVDIYR